MIHYILALLVSYTALALGIYITKKTPSEHGGLKRYAPLMQRAFYLLIIGLLLTDFSTVKLIVASVALIGLWKPLLGYPLLGVLFFYSYPDLRVSLAIFLYGLASGAAYYLSHRSKRIMNALLTNSGYLVAALGMYAVSLL